MATLADPFTLGPLSLRNRLIANAHGTGHARDGGVLPGVVEAFVRTAANVTRPGLTALSSTPLTAN